MAQFKTKSHTPPSKLMGLYCEWQFANETDQIQMDGQHIDDTDTPIQLEMEDEEKINIAYWSGLPFPSPGDLFNPGIKPGSLVLQADSLPTEQPGKPVL